MAQFNLVDQTNLFKINYYKKSENMYNSANVLQGRIKKRYDFIGKQRFVAPRSRRNASHPTARHPDAGPESRRSGWHRCIRRAH